MGFNVGDRVKVISSPWNPELRGKVGEVVEIRGYSESSVKKSVAVIVIFSRSKGTKSGKPGKPGKQFLFLPKELELISYVVKVTDNGVTNV